MSGGRRLARILMHAALACAAVALWVAPAAAHSFLAATDPSQGARLAGPPESVALQFSEPVVDDAVHLTLRQSGGELITIPTAELESGGAVVRQPLTVLDPDVYVVSWQVTSAVDGHDSAGEFAFAVGTDPSAEVPLIQDRTPDVDPSSAAVAWLFFAGLSIAAGGLAAPPLRGDAAPAHRWLRTGGSIALAAVLVRLVGGTAQSAVGIGGLALPAAAGLLSLVLARGRAARSAVLLGLLAAAAVAWAARGHSAAALGPWGAALDAVHLLAAAAWTGGLAFVVLALWRHRGQHRPARMAVVGRYAPSALVLVAVVSLSGTVQAVLLLPGWDALWSTPYGSVLVVKTALLLVALLAAAVARRWGLGGKRPRLLRGRPALSCRCWPVCWRPPRCWSTPHHRHPATCGTACWARRRSRVPRHVPWTWQGP